MVHDLESPLEESDMTKFTGGAILWPAALFGVSLAVSGFCLGSVAWAVITAVPL